MFRLFSVVLFFAVCIFITLSYGCKKDSDDPVNKDCQVWNENWLIGTWEGTTPSNSQPFAGTKIRIVFEKAFLQVFDSIAGNPRKVWTYSGTFTWDVGGTAWNAGFDSTNYPLHNTILWECLEYKAIGQTVNNVSFFCPGTVKILTLPTIHGHFRNEEVAS